MTRKLKRPLALLSSLAMMLTCLPGNMAQVLTTTAGASDTVTFTVLTGAPDGFDDEGYDKLLDGATNTEWCCNFDGSASVVIKASQLVIVTGYSIATGNDSRYESGRNPVAWTLSGCNDYDEAYKSGTWVVLDTITDGGLPAANETYTDFEIQDAAGKYQYFKLNITQVKSGSLMQIGELKLEYTTCDHQWELTGNMVDPTCEEGGYEIAKCAVCGEEKKTPNGVPATGHVWVEERTVAPTCADDGYVVEKCSQCGTERQEFNGEYATGHDWVEERTVAPTCVDDGYVVEKCSVCDAERQEFNGEYATGHDWVVEKTVAPTCVDDGYVVKKCSVCDTERQESNGEFATGHDWVEKETVPATCYKDGYVVEKCSRCSTEQQRSNGESATGHEFDASSDEPDVCIHCGYLRVTVSEPATDAEGRYMIGTPGELYWFAGLVNGTLDGVDQNTSAKAILTADITINSDLIESLGVDQKTGIVSNVEGLHAWVPIGYNSSHVYSGTFDGNDHTISGLYCDIDSEKNRLLGTEYIGLFGRINGTVQNLNITDSYFNGKSEVGALCGWNDTYSTLSNCTVDAVVAANKTIEGEYTNVNVGGLSGYSESATIRNCSFAGAVYFGGSATYPHVGGLLGFMSNTAADCCYTTAKVYAESYEPLIGFDYVNKRIFNCYYLADSESTADPSAKTAAQFASGEVAYLLEQGCSTNEGDSASAYTGPVWGQEIGKDALPVLNGMTVYRHEEYTGCVYNPGDPTYSYANTAAEPKYGDFPIENGICQHCGGYEPAVLNEAGFYEISNAGNLYWFAELVNGTLKNVERNASAKAILTANITVNENLIVSLKRGANGEEFNSWTPIGYGVTSDGDLIVFDGIFDGQGYRISGLYHSASYRTNLALFGRTGENAVISNVKIVDTYFYANPQGNYVAGVCGQNYGTIKSCQIYGMITGNEYVAGICGQNYGTIKNCYNTGSATGGNYVSGVCGQNYGTVENSYNTGSISGSWWVSGVCGNNTGLVVNCYNTGKIMAESASDAVCGISNSDENVVNCYYLDSCAAEGSDLRFQLGESKTIEQFNSGEVAFFLRQDYTTGEGEDAVTCDGSVWGQEIGTDDLPLLNGKTVYHNTRYAGCNSTSPVAEEFYSNTDQNIYVPHRGFAETGICSDCGLLEEPVLNESGFYEISNAGNLYWFAGLVNGTLDGVDQNTFANALLTADITVNEDLLASLTVDENNEVTNGDSFRNWIPIGGGATSFDGMFAGQDHTISGLYLNDSIRQSGGLFGKTGEGAAIVNVKIADSYFNAYGPVGGVCGYNGGTIANCSNAGTVSGQCLVGGICGYNERIVADCSNAGTVSGGYGIGGVCGGNACVLTNCCNTGAVSGATYMGGVCGIAQSPDGDGQHMDRTISNCYNTGDVTGSSDSIGGICGVCCDYTISNCYNTGAIHGDIKVGGLCGYNDFSTVTNSYNIGTVSGTDDVGGLFGRNSGSAVNCYYLDSCAAEGTVFDSVCGESKTMEQFNSGEVAYLLQQGSIVGDGDAAVIYEGVIWGQEIGKDDLPDLNGKTVYRNEVYAGCVHDLGDPTYVYANTAAEPKHGDFIIENGICQYCGLLEAAVLNDDGVYEISNAGQLYWFAGLVNGTLNRVAQNTSAKAILTADITVNEDLLASLTFDADKDVTNGDGFRAWTPIGGSAIDSTSSEETQYICYDGEFDGQNHTISGLFYDTSRLYVGLFGRTGENAKISNVQIADSYFHGWIGTGGICGCNGGTIANCSNAGTVHGNDSGGVCGQNQGTITNCYNTGTVIGAEDAGGVCGNNDGTIDACYNTGEVKSYASTPWYYGGVCGKNQGTITNCYNTGSVNANNYVGGICGNNAGLIVNSYNTGSYGGVVYVGSVCGNLAGDGKVVNCYCLDTDGGDSYQGEGKTIEQFHSGEVAYLLGQGCTIGADADAVTYSGSVWGQEIGKDDLPGLNGKTVYQNTRYEGCNNTSPVAEEFYSNTDQDIYGPHRGLEETGICSDCGLLEAAVLNEDGAYEISNAGQLYWFAELVNGTLDGVDQNASANAILTADITINENLLASLRFDTDKDVTNGSRFRSWTMIGSLSNSYEGIFDGQDHTISGLYLNDSTLISAGLFGYISNGTIANVGIVDSYIRGKYNVGAVCGASNVGVIKNCYNTGTVTGIQNVGGLCGYAFSDSIISASYNTGTVNGTSGVGSICGEIAESVIVNCYNTGDVYGETIVGGLCGHNQNGTIVNCYSSGRVHFFSDAESVGGLCASNDGVIANCYYNNEMNNIVAASAGTGQLINVKAYTYPGFAGGEVAYLLAQGCTVGEGSEAKFFDGSIWGLELDVEDTPLLNGKTVYRNEEYNTCSPEIGDPNYYYSNTKADPSFRDHEFSHGICEVCGKLENGRDAFLGASITLTDGVIVNYFLTLTEEALADPDAYIDFTTTQGVHKTVLLSEGIATEDGMYKFSLKLRPDQMAEKITAKVVYSDGTPGSEATDYSVVDYVVQLAGEDTSEEEFALITALIQYGGAAQLYTGNNIENLADQSLPAFDPNVTISDDYAISLSGAVDGIKIKGASLMADALTTIRVRCEVTKGSISDYTFTCDGVELTPVKSGKYYYVYIRSISPKDLSHMYSIAVTDKSGSTRTLNYGVLSYAKSIIEAEEGMYDSSLVNMMKALYYYSEAAKNY